ncbi:MAG TPA: NlpC/P60 family protein [Fimbriimonadaceae bacterium]|nr:NlpC/P60 family protein [Fimbriimonadaceae bacterium]
MPIKNLTLGAIALLSSAALAQNHNNTHIVRKGETLEKISKWTGVSKKQLILTNHLNSKKFRPGLVLYIPTSSSSGQKHYDLHAKGYAPYTIRSHDSDWKIANMFHMTPKAVRQLNPSVSWGHPHPGTKIRIPMKNAFVYKLAQIPVIRSRYAVVTRPDTIVRSAPGSNASRIVKVDAGRHVRVLDRDNHWYKVRFEYGTEGWVRGDLLASEQPKIVAERHTKHSSHSSVVAYHSTRTGRNSRHDAFYGNLPTAGGDMLAFAESMKGVPYRYGAASRSSTDCSGFALQVLRHEGIKMPRTAAEQSTKGQHVGKGELKPGDLVFFHTSRGSRISHVGIYIGNGKFIHASSGGGKVQVNSLSEGYYHNRFATARRVAKVKHHETKADKISKAKHEDDDAMKKAEKDIKSTSQVSDAVGN